MAARSRMLLAVGLVFILAFLTIVLLYRNSPALYNQYDDAYISYRYAIHAARGDGLVYNIGEKIDSASSFLHVLVLTGMYRIGIHDLEAAATWLGVCAAAGTATIVYLSLWRLTKRRFLAVLFSGLTALHGFMSAWAISGMESTLFTFFVALFVHHYLIHGRATFASGLVLAAVVLTRVEGALLIAAATVGFSVDWVTRARLLHARPAVALLLPALAAGGALLIFRLAYYGSVLPDAYAFKHIWSAYQSRPEELWQSWESTTLVAGVLALGGIGCLPTWRARAGMSVYLLVSAVSLGFGPRSGWARYSIHLLPIVMILAGLAVSEMRERLRVLRWVAVAAILAQTYGSAMSARAFMEKASYHQACRKQIGRRLQALGSDSPVLSSDIGAIAYEAIDVGFIDAVGLTSPGILKVYLQGGALDPVFDEARPVLVADTVYKGKGFQALSVLAAPSGYIRKRVMPPRYLRDRKPGAWIDQCVAPDGITVALAPLVARDGTGSDSDSP